MSVMAVIGMVYITAINLIAFVCYRSDKIRAQKNLKRTSESTLILLAVLGGSLGAFIAMRVFHHKTKKLKFRICIPLLLLLQLVTFLALAGAYTYFSNYYHADSDARAALQSYDDVEVDETDDFYFFDGTGSKAAFIFYPGAKVEASSYAPLMRRIASKGTDCFLVKMPLNFALLGINRADSIIRNYEYDKIMVGGHSLGGVAASMYAADNPDAEEAVVFLASYSSKDLSHTTLKTLVIYGTDDNVLNLEAFKENASNFSVDNATLQIKGGNHAQFGNYGPQDGDGVAEISAGDQQEITAEAIVKFASGL